MSSTSLAGRKALDISGWLAASKADVMFEGTSLNVDTGQPAIDYLRAALLHGAHAITANKGPVVHAYPELSELAAARGQRFLFESVVMDGAPIFSLFRECLPAVQVLAIRGILNSTTNVILTEMENGLTFDESLQKAQEMGIAETDPSYDVEGWDATVKLAALATVLMGVRVRPQDVDRRGISGLNAEAVCEARRSARPYKLVCHARREGTKVASSVKPEQLSWSDPMAHVTGSSSIVTFETDIFPALTITETDPGLGTTAYGMLADFITAATGHPR